MFILQLLERLGCVTEQQFEDVLKKARKHVFLLCFVCVVRTFKLRVEFRYLVVMVRVRG